MNTLTKVRLHWDRVSGWGLVAVGAIVLAFGWYKVSKTPYPAEQMPYIVSAGIVGALLVVFGAAMLISADLRDEWHKLDRVETLLTKALATSDEPSATADADQVVTRIDSPRPQSAAGRRA
ncbi:hypothetical protein GCM10009547_19900 [Sporichthya brevicatena]|uniref:Uncharacterized protein n=1 Tax=Sporichthya brevicatena TaxID=171442 RepID=A0ABP3RZV6_9ACTN